MSVTQTRAASLCLVLLAAIPSLACAAQPDDPAARISAAFGNTVTSTYPDGRSQKIWLRPDGSWTGLSRTRKDLAGTWTVKGDKVCLRQKTPPTLPFSFCTPFPQDAHVGVAWASKDVGGTPIRLRLDAGA
jgi:hypothetical protein